MRLESLSRTRSASAHADTSWRVPVAEQEGEDVVLAIVPGLRDEG